MRVYRWAILTSLAGLTVILLGTAVFAMQMPSYQPVADNELHKQTQRDMPLRLSERGADYLAIVADEPGFLTALLPLLDHRQENGLQVTAVSLKQIATEFGDGAVTPQVIRDFLLYTTENWQPAPQFVLLVGDAIESNQISNTQQDLIPTKLIALENTAAASDSWFTEGTAILIGRFPVQTSAQITAIVNKTIAYETAVIQSPDAAWLQRALLIADDKPDFDIASDHLEDNLDNSGYHIHDLHLSQNQDAYTNILAVLNRGVSILDYTGNGDETSFGNGAAFTADDVRLLQNEHRLPIFTAFSCQNGSFTDLHQDSIAEQLLLTEHGGVVAAIGTSRPANTEQSLILSALFYKHLLDGNANTLGKVLAETKTAVNNNDELETAVHTYNLLGDPALHYYQPPPAQIVQPFPTPVTFTLVNDR